MNKKTRIELGKGICKTKKYNKTKQYNKTKEYNKTKGIQQIRTLLDNGLKQISGIQ